jgi:MFS family permease
VTAGAQPRSLQSWWMIVVFFFTAMHSYTDRFILSLLVDPLRADLNISDTQVSLLQGLAFALVYSFAGLPFGRLADRVSRRAVIIAGVVLWSAATIGCGYAVTFARLFAARVLVGIGEAALAPAAVSMIADSFPPERRGTALSVFIAGMAIGGGAAISIGGSLVGAATLGLFKELPVVGILPPWRAALVLLAAPGILIVLLLLTVHEPPRRQAAASAVSLSDALTRLRSRAGTLLPLFLAVGLLSAADFSFQNWTPALLSRRFGLSALDIGRQLGLLAILSGVGGTMAGGLLGDFGARRRGEVARTSLAMGATLLGLAGSAVGLASTPDQVLVCFVLWGTMASASEALGIAAIQAVVPDEVRGVSVAITSLCNMLLGLACGTTLTALLTDRWFGNPRSVGASIGSVVLPSALMALALLWRARRCGLDSQKRVFSLTP